MGKGSHFGVHTGPQSCGLLSTLTLADLSAYSKQADQGHKVGAGLQSPAYEPPT